MATVRADVTASVWSIECEVGDEVRPGDTLLILESMKMEIPVAAESASRVAEIHCIEGQGVCEGDSLVVLVE